jgi:hypothetical protein
MSRFTNAEWDIIAVATTGVGLLAIASTVILRTFMGHMAWWEAVAQYAVSGGLLAISFFRHAFYGEAMAYSQAHLIVSGLFCAWNLYWVYRVRARPQ